MATYLLYGKDKIDRMFKHHIIRGNIIQIWKKYHKLIPQQKPLWVIPLEVIQFVAGTKEKEPHTYEELIKFVNNEPVLRAEGELDRKLNWWFYLQIKNLFNQDKKNK